MIKARYTGRTSASADLYKTALTLCQRGEKAAEALKKRVRHQAAKKILAVYRKAKKKGFERGRVKAEEAACENLLEIEMAYRQVVADANKDCLELAISIAKEVSAKAILDSHESLVIRINSAINNLQDTRSIRITVNQLDLAAIERSLKLHSPGLNIEINTSTDITRGNALLETHSGKVTLDWEQHFENISNRLQTALDKKLHKEAA